MKKISLITPLLFMLFALNYCSSTPSSSSSSGGGGDVTPTPNPSLPSCHNTGCSAYVGQTLTDANGVNLGTVIAFKTQYIKVKSPTNYTYAIDYNGKFWLMGDIVTDNTGALKPASDSSASIHQSYALGDTDGDFTLPVFQSWSDTVDTDAGFCIKTKNNIINMPDSSSHFKVDPNKSIGNSHSILISTTGALYSGGYVTVSNNDVITCTINDVGVFPANNSIKPILVAPDGTQILG